MSLASFLSIPAPQGDRCPTITTDQLFCLGQSPSKLSWTRFSTSFGRHIHVFWWTSKSMGHGGCVGASLVLSRLCTRAWGRGSVWRWSVCFLARTFPPSVYNQERSYQVRRFIFMWTFRRLPMRVTVRSNSSTSLLTAEGILATPGGVWRHLHLIAFLAVMMLMQ